MKLILTSLLMFLLFAAISIHAASDADVTLLKVKTVVIEESVITIVVAEAKTRITLIRDGHDPKFTGDQWHGMPVTRVQVISDKATFTIKRPREAGLEEWWQKSLKNAKDLQEGKEVGRIAFYEPDIAIKGNMIDSITGFGFLLSKGQ